MLTPSEQEFILARAYVPEHLVDLMALISGGEPFLVENSLGFARDNWVILIGYPLEVAYSHDWCERVINRVIPIHKPEYLWFIGPDIPDSLAAISTERETDRYYILDIDKTRPGASLLRQVEKASKGLRFDKNRSFSRGHEDLVREFLKREKLSPRLRELYLAMPRYVSHSQNSLVLSAWDPKGNLSAFFVIDLSAKDFSTYLLGCYSRTHYVPHASDLLFYEMISLTRELGKQTIHLGLGVNEGIERFKMKWGGTPWLPYEFREAHYRRSKMGSLIRDLADKL